MILSFSHVAIHNTLLVGNYFALANKLCDILIMDLKSIILTQLIEIIADISGDLKCVRLGEIVLQ